MVAELTWKQGKVEGLILLHQPPPQLMFIHQTNRTSLD